VKIAVASMVLNSVLGVTLMFPLHHAGLALATSLSAWFNGVFLLNALLRKKAYQPKPGWLRYAMQLIAANLGLILVLVYFRKTPDVWFLWHWPERVLHLGELMVGGMVVYFGMLIVTGVRLHHFRGN
jgi:putative peptidoglycan lipid II flippase